MIRSRRLPVDEWFGFGVAKAQSDGRRGSISIPWHSCRYWPRSRRFGHPASHYAHWAPWSPFGVFVKGRCHGQFDLTQFPCPRVIHRDAPKHSNVWHSASPQCEQWENAYLGHPTRHARAGAGIHACQSRRRAYAGAMYGWATVDWFAVPGPIWYRPEAAAGAVQDLATAVSADGAALAVGRLVDAVGNDHRGTLYPAAVGRRVTYRRRRLVGRQPRQEAGQGLTGTAGRGQLVGSGGQPLTRAQLRTSVSEYTAATAQRGAAARSRVS